MPPSRDVTARVRLLRWVGRRDPGYQTLRRGLRLSVVTSVIFLGARYGLHDVTLAVYGLFAAIALGLLGQLPGGPAERFHVLMLTLPVAWLLVSAGTVLAVRTWAAAAGMLVVAFVVSFVGIGGPRLGGLAPGLQLLYILPCFPPYAPQTLLMRLSGVTLGVVLLAAAQLVLWPDPAPVPYRRRVAAAALAVGGYLDLVADAAASRPVARQYLLRRRAEAFDAMGQLRLNRLPPLQRPGSASRRDWALRDATSALGEMLSAAERLPELPAGPPQGPAGGFDVPGEVSVGAFPLSAPEERAAGRAGAGTAIERLPDPPELLRRAAALASASGRTLLGETPLVDPVELEAFNRAVEELRRLPDPDPGHPEPADTVRLCMDAIALQTAEQVRTVAVAARIVAGLPVAVAFGHPPPQPYRHKFWYAQVSSTYLYSQRFRAHLTVRSVYLQGAVRIALALAVARVVAGYLHLAHGFWVLLATLTLLRSTAADTRTTLRPAIQGTILGAAAGAALLLLNDEPTIYEAVLPVIMLLTFAVGPVLGLAWAQGLITVLLTVLFAQLGPADLQLIEARFLDVLVGALIGILAGVLFWPRGVTLEVRRAVARYLECGALTIRDTVATLTGRGGPGGELGRAHEAMVLANASVLQYAAQRHGSPVPNIDWQAALHAGQQMVRGGEFRLTDPNVIRLPPTGLSAQLDDFARELSHAYLDLARQVREGRIIRRVSAPAPPKQFVERVHELRVAGQPRTVALGLLDLDIWLVNLRDTLDRIQHPPAPGDH
ncbi:FUSC family protein [Micromonospora sp. NPDC049559]|uniref:FUSC family protein n=1 Tax=Micromonospora sp. NPDC049559 TaxID=3155923 RepID=UPI00343E12F8